MDFRNELEYLSLVSSGLTAKIRLGWKGLPGTDALAYYKKLFITAIKSVLMLAAEPVP